MRFCCKQKELRRQRMYEKALDACATSPFARGINRWVLAGVCVCVCGSQLLRRGSLAEVFLRLPLHAYMRLQMFSVARQACLANAGC